MDIKLSEATLRAAVDFDLSIGTVCKLLDYPVQQLGYGLSHCSDAGRTAKKMVATHRTIKVLMRGNRTKMRAWAHTRNSGTGGVPAHQMCSTEGLDKVSVFVNRHALYKEFS